MIANLPGGSKVEEFVIWHAGNDNGLIDRLNASGEITVNAGIVTTERILIQNDQIALPMVILGDIIHNKALIFDGVQEDLYYIYDEATCTTNNNIVYFDPSDNLNGRYAIVSYLTSN